MCCKYVNKLVNTNNSFNQCRWQGLPPSQSVCPCLLQNFTSQTLWRFQHPEKMYSGVHVFERSCAFWLMNYDVFYNFCLYSYFNDKKKHWSLTGFISRRVLMTPRNHSFVFEHVCCIVGTDFNCKQIKTKHLPVFCIVMNAWINQDKRHYNSMLPLIPGDRRRRTRRAFTAGTRHGTPNTDHRTPVFSCVTFVLFGTVIDAKVVITKNTRKVKV